MAARLAGVSIVLGAMALTVIPCEFFKTKGAGVLLFNELIGSGDGYEFVFQLRRMDNLKPLSQPVRRDLEPRFAMQLAELITGS